MNMSLFGAFVLAAGVVASAAPFSVCRAQISVVGTSIREHEALPGTSYTGSFTVRNDGTESQEIRAYLTDYRFAASGKVEFAEAGSTQRSNASWLSLSPSTLRLAAHQTATIGYTVKIPVLNGNAATGSYWSVIMIEGTPSIATVSSRAVRVTAIFRQGMQLVTHIGNSGAASVALSKPQLVPDSTGTALQFDAANDGVRARRLTLSLDLYAEDGKFIGKFTRERGLVYPGSSIRQTFSLGPLAKGIYLASVVADAGQDDLFAGNFKLTL